MKVRVQEVKVRVWLVVAAILPVAAQPVVRQQDAAQAVAVNAYVPPKETAALASTFVDWDSLVAVGTAMGEVRRVFDNPTAGMEKLEVHVTTLRAGMESHPVHRHAWEEMLLVKEGEFEVSINGVKERAGAGALVFFAANDAHNAKNVGAKPGTYYVINFVPVAPALESMDPTLNSQKTRVEDGAPGGSAVQRVEGGLPGGGATRGLLKSGVRDCDAMTRTATAVGSRVTCVDGATQTFVALESHISTLNVGQRTAANIVDANDEIVVIKAGQVEVTVNGVASRMNAGSLMYWAPNDKRSLRNVGGVPTSYQVIRVTSAKTAVK